MRVLYYYRELNTPMYWWQRTHFIDELKRSGHEIVTFNPLDYPSAECANEKVVEYLRKDIRFDLFLSCVDSSWLYSKTIREIKSMGYPTALICWDNLELPYKHKAIAPDFDVVWITSNETEYLFKKWGCKKVLFQTYAANPYYFKPSLVDDIDAIGFIGSPYGSRTNVLNTLTDAEIPCQVYSNALFQKSYNTSKGDQKGVDVVDIMVKASRYLRFPIGRKVLYSTIKNKFVSHSKLNMDSPSLLKNKSVSDEEMISLYSDFRLSLNISELRDTYILPNPIHKIHLRAFEIPMSGGLEFASYTDELASYFEDGKEIVLYRSKEEMVDKAKFYLSENQARAAQKMKEAARKRAEAEHTWTKRFNNLFANL